MNDNVYLLYDSRTSAPLVRSSPAPSEAHVEGGLSKGVDQTGLDRSVQMPKGHLFHFDPGENGKRHGYVHPDGGGKFESEAFG